MVFLLVFTFISILAITGSFELAVEWVWIMWEIIDLAGMTAFKLVTRSILQNILS